MATDLERLVVSLDADITRLTKQLARAGVQVGDFAKDADRQTKQAGKKIADNLAGANDNAGGLNYNQFQILGHVARATFESIAAGASPLRVVAQEGVKASAAIGEGGLAGLLKDTAISAAGMISPLKLAGGSLVALGGAALYAYASYEDAQKAITTGLSGIGAASHATVNDIEEIGEKIAETQKISVSAGRTIALALAKTGKVDVNDIGPIGALTRGLANLTGDSLDEAGQKLATIFSDPAKGAEELNALIGTLDGRTHGYIRTLAAQGDRQEAIRVLLAAVTPALSKAAENTGLWARAWERVKTAAEGAATSTARAIATVVDGKTGDQQAVALKQRIDQIKASQYSESDIQAGAAATHLTPEQYRAKVQGSQDAELAKLQAQYDALTKSIEAKNKAQQQGGDKVEAAQLSVEASKVVQAYDDMGAAIEKVEADRKRLGEGLAANLANPSAEIEGGTAKAVDSFNALSARLEQLKADYAAGGAAAAAALREANFSQQVASANSFEKGLAQINHQYDEMILNARSAGNLKAVPTIETARQSAVDAYKAESGQKAQGQVNLPDDFTRIVIGAEGNNAGKNPRSSASGIGQFIDSTFVALYRKEFADLAATMDDAAVLKLKSDFATNQKLIEAYGRENAVKLQNAGFKATAQNLYLAHNYGPKGAIDLLSAAPGTSATSILGQRVADANPAVAGHTAQQVIDEAARRSQRYSQAGRAQQDQVIAERAQAEAYGQSTAAAERLASIQEQLNADREKGGALGTQFATAQDLIKASSSALTPELQRQREEILALADARAKATQSGLSARFQTDMREARDALGRTSDQQSIYEQARQYADPGSAQFAGITDELTKLHELTERKSDTGDFVKGLVGDLIQGKDAATALKDELTRVAEKLADKAIDNALAGLFSPGGAGTGSLGFSGLFGGLGKVFGFAGGGPVYGPGTATSDSIPAMLSAGEFVIPADVMRKHGGLIHAVYSGRVPRFASGGPVGRLAPTPAAIAARGGDGGIDFVVEDHVGAKISAQSTWSPDHRRQVRTIVDQALAENARYGSRGVSALVKRGRNGIGG